MSESEGCRSEAINDGRIDVRIVRVTVSTGQCKDAKFVHEVCTQYDGKPLCVGDVL